ncbi:hypothetical protein RFI_05795 [Reticulomyxa filosa]|uniref:Uncharacterized protein n=1 Tax=Reticulomyxa filosa TaxID=46433 RepID=X6NZL0_RETFI|nr:hypothetical protein RFI_05795 [Reticulomyxa filosa]|eukprot:ETO31323.1 hypothetical protein RFI_05795 [Reticulomyxa filosa]
MDPLWLCLSKLKRRRFTECVELTDDLLSKNGDDSRAWLVKTYAETERSYIDDSEMEEKTLEEEIINEELLASAPRPGTSLRAEKNISQDNMTRLQTGSRPQTARNRPLTGYVTCQTARLGTSSTSLAVSNRILKTSCLTAAKKGAIDNIETNTSIISKKTKDGSISKAFFNYVYYVLKDYKAGLDIASEWTQKEKFEDWFWKMKLGQCYYKMQMYREAEKQLQSVLKHNNNPCMDSYLYLGKVYQRLDQPNKATQLYSKAFALPHLRHEKHLLLAHARVEEQLQCNPQTYVMTIYKSILRLQPCCIEPLACLATHYFYDHQPEMALRLLHYLLQMGVQNASLFNNMGLCCFYSGQYDMCFPCFSHALLLCDNSSETGEVWYNISHIFIALGDFTLAYQALKIAIAHHPTHSEAWNNLAVVQWRLQQQTQKQAPLQSDCKHLFTTSTTLADYLFEPLFNIALLAFRQGNCNEALQFVSKSLAIFPLHHPSLSLKDSITRHFFT